MIDAIKNDALTIEQLPSEDDARIWVYEVKKGLSNVREYLLKIRDTGAWKVLGYASFEELGHREFGFTRQHVNRLATAAEIELSLSLEPTGSNLSERQLRPLAQVPAEERQAIWDAAQQAAREEQAKLAARHVEDAVREYKAKADAEAQEAEELARILADTERANKDRTDALNKQIREQSEMLDAVKEQRDRMLAEDKRQIDRLKADLARERESLQGKLEAAKREALSNDGDELARRVRMMEARIEQLRAEEQGLKSRISLKLQSDKALQAGKQAMLAFSVEMMEFQERLHETPEQTTVDMGAAWLKAADEMDEGARVVREIARAITGKQALTEESK